MFAFQYNSIIQGPVTVKAPFRGCCLQGQVESLSTTALHFSFSLFNYWLQLCNPGSHSKFYTSGADGTTCGASATTTRTSWELLSALCLSLWCSSAFQTSMKLCFQCPNEVKETFFIFVPKAQSNQF